MLKGGDSVTKQYPEQMVFGLDIGTRSIVGIVGYKQSESRFTVAAQQVQFHETRAIIDGQVHDIEKVAQTIVSVKRALEQRLERRLPEVCIAAAGRVLKTVTVHTDVDLEGETVIEKEQIRTLIASGIEQAYGEIRRDTENERQQFHCVGHTVMRYYLNDYVMTSLEAHKGSRISADIIATFLPQEVVDGLYQSVEKAGLKVENMTLEPIAAIQVAIPERFRLLNIALVDVGAGTSDISITKDGSIVAYGMIPKAGDAITEAIMRSFLTDFLTAEKMKLAASGKRKELSFKDVIGMRHKITTAELREAVLPVVKEMTGQIAEQIIALNGGKAVSAVFVVGGGGKFSSFLPLLAEQLGLPQARVVLRGEEVLGEVDFMEEIKKDSTLVTPVGICLNYYEQKNNLIFVYVNNERIKLYDNSRLTVMDAALASGFPKEQLFPQRGKELEFLLDGERRMLRGETGEAAQIRLNQKTVGLNAPVSQHDKIELIAATRGERAHCRISELPELKERTLTFQINGHAVVCPRLLLANGKFVTEEYEIQNGDVLELIRYYTLEQLLTFMDVEPVGEILVNQTPSYLEERVYENFTVSFGLEETRRQAEQELSATTEAARESDAMTVQVNGTMVTLHGKKRYFLVDVLDVYPFDVSAMHGSEVVIRRNGNDADFTTPLAQGDSLELYWRE